METSIVKPPTTILASADVVRCIGNSLRAAYGVFLETFSEELYPEEDLSVRAWTCITDGPLAKLDAIFQIACAQYVREAAYSRRCAIMSRLEQREAWQMSLYQQFSDSFRAPSQRYESARRILQKLADVSIDDCSRVSSDCNGEVLTHTRDWASQDSLRMHVWDAISAATCSLERCAYALREADEEVRAVDQLSWRRRKVGRGALARITRVPMSPIARSLWELVKATCIPSREVALVNSLNRHNTFSWLLSDRPEFAVPLKRTIEFHQNYTRFVDSFRDALSECDSNRVTELFRPLLDSISKRRAQFESQSRENEVE